VFPFKISTSLFSIPLYTQTSINMVSYTNIKQLLGLVFLLAANASAMPTSPTITASLDSIASNLNSSAAQNTTTPELSAEARRAKAQDDAYRKLAIYHWQKHKECFGFYFFEERANMQAANAVEHYLEWTQNTAVFYPNLLKRYGEATLFAIQSWNGYGFRCSIGDGGCINQPTCEYVLAHAESHNEDMTPDEVFELARKNWFIMKLFVSLAHQFRHSWVSARFQLLYQHC